MVLAACSTKGLIDLTAMPAAPVIMLGSTVNIGGVAPTKVRVRVADGVVPGVRVRDADRTRSPTTGVNLIMASRAAEFTAAAVTFTVERKPPSHATVRMPDREATGREPTVVPVAVVVVMPEMRVETLEAPRDWATQLRAVSVTVRHVVALAAWHWSNMENISCASTAVGR